MALWGVSGSDLKVFGTNTAVGAGVLASCAVAALAVSKVGAKLFAKARPDADSEDNQRLSQYIGFAVGLCAAYAAYKYIPASRCALVADASTSKMFKIGALQAIAGAILDNYISQNFMVSTVVGLGGALATRYGNLALAGLGAVGAGLGSGLIER